MRFTKNVWLHCVIYALIGAATGAHVGLSDDPRLLAVTALLPIFWRFAPSRYAATFLACAYYLTAARGVPHGAAIFFGDGNSRSLLLGTVLWLSSSAALTLPWTILWSNRKNTIHQILRLTAVYILITIPPIGLFGWASPILVAGVLFPHSAWLGIAAMTLAPPIFHTFRQCKRKVVSVMLPCACILYILARAYIMPFDIQHPNGFVALDTHHSKSASGSARFTDAFIRSTDVFNRVISQKTPYVLLPETIAGAWTAASKQLWLPLGRYLEKRGQTLILGAEIYDENLKYDNCMIYLGKDDKPIYRQRVPVPISMWRPFGGKGTAKAHWLDDGRITLLDGRTAVCLLCYEQYIALPILLSMLKGKADMLICSANQWWSRGTSIPNIQIQSSKSWCALFSLKYVSASNS